jgi:hypothetical protein
MDPTAGRIRTGALRIGNENILKSAALNQGKNVENQFRQC